MNRVSRVSRVIELDQVNQVNTRENSSIGSLRRVRTGRSSSDRSINRTSPSPALTSIDRSGAAGRRSNARRSRAGSIGPALQVIQPGAHFRTHSGRNLHSQPHFCSPDAHPAQLAWAAESLASRLRLFLRLQCKRCMEMQFLAEKKKRGRRESTRITRITTRSLGSTEAEALPGSVSRYAVAGSIHDSMRPGCNRTSVFQSGLVSSGCPTTCPNGAAVCKTQVEGHRASPSANEAI